MQGTAPRSMGLEPIPGVFTGRPQMAAVALDYNQSTRLGARRMPVSSPIQPHYIVPHSEIKEEDGDMFEDDHHVYFSSPLQRAFGEQQPSQPTSPRPIRRQHHTSAPHAYKHRVQTVGPSSMRQHANLTNSKALTAHI